MPTAQLGMPPSVSTTAHRSLISVLPGMKPRSLLVFRKVGRALLANYLGVFGSSGSRVLSGGVRRRDLGLSWRTGSTVRRKAMGLEHSRFQFSWVLCGPLRVPGAARTQRCQSEASWRRRGGNWKALKSYSSYSGTEPPEWAQAPWVTYSLFASKTIWHCNLLQEL